MPKIIIYHGSSKIIEKPQFGYGSIKNDYGLGFYLTEDLELAKEWAVSDGKDGYANKYEIDFSGLNILDLSDAEYNVLNWITILLENRTFDLKNDIAKIGKDFLLKNFYIPYEDRDIIIGYRADDSYFTLAENFLNNIISIKRLEEVLKYGNLGEQIVLKSKKAFERIKFLGYEKAPNEIYYPLRKERNEKAREKFLSDKKGSFDINAKYLNDVMREGGEKNVKPRIR